jgi:hypothetical protein
MQMVPSELAIGEVYFPRLLIAAMLGFVLAWLTARMLNRYRLSRFGSVLKVEIRIKPDILPR